MLCVPNMPGKTRQSLQLGHSATDHDTLKPTKLMRRSDVVIAFTDASVDTKNIANTFKIKMCSGCGGNRPGQIGNERAFKLVEKK